MEPIIEPISLDLIKAELTPAKKLRNTNKSNNEIYVINHHDSPNVMMEIGRLREEAFRDSGGGSGLSMDIDEFDTMENPYHQLIVWDPDAEKILGGYRFIYGNDIQIDENGQPILATAHMFHFSKKFMKEYLPYTIELGRSFVAPEYQSSKAGAKALFALDNLWDGIGALIALHPEAKYLLGKVTMYSSYNEEARNMLFYFLQRYFPDRQHLIEGIHPLEMNIDTEKFDKIFTGESYAENYNILRHAIREYKEIIPPLINAYMNLSSSMKTFDTVPNQELGGVYETGILITIKDIYHEKYDRYTKW